MISPRIKKLFNFGLWKICWVIVKYKNMVLSWNEIKDRALQFSKEWAETSNEEADAKQFLVAFFNVFGISSKRVV